MMNAIDFPGPDAMTNPTTRRPKFVVRSTGFEAIEGFYADRYKTP